MTNRLISNLSLYTIGDMLPKAASFFLLPIYISYLAPSEYGIVGAMTAFVGFLGIFLTLNFERSIFRLFYDYDDEQKQKIFLGTIFIWILIFGTSLVLILIVLREFVDKFYESINFWPYFLISIFTVYLNLFEYIPKIFLQVQQRAKTFVALGLVQFLITNCSILYFVVYLKMKADGYLLGGLISAALMLPYFLWYTRKIVTFRFDRKIFKAISRFSLPIFPAIIASQVIDLSDRIFIEKYLSVSDLGLYSLSYSVSGMVLVFTAAFKKAYDPYFYKIANSLEINKAKKILKKTNTIYYLVTLLICFSIATLSKEFITIFMNENYAESYKLIPILCVAYAFSKISGLINLSFYQNKNTKVMMYVSMAAATANVVLNLLLIPYYGCIGAAYATTITYAFMLVIKYYFSKKEFFIEIDFGKLFITTSFLIALYLGVNTISHSVTISVLLKICVLILAAILLYVGEKKNIQKISEYV